MASFKSYFKREISKSLAWLIMAGTAVFLLGGSISYYIYAAPTKYDLTVKEPTKVASKAAHIVATTPVADPTSGWKKYENADLSISFKYPASWKDLTMSNVEAKTLVSMSAGNYYTTNLQDTHFDPDNAFTITASNKNFVPFGPTDFNRTSVDQAWTVDQFKANMGMEEGNRILGYQKIGNGSLLVISSVNIECSPSLSVNILTPLNSDYPNFDISIAIDADNDSITKEYIAKAQNNSALDVCDRTEPYMAIGDKILAGNYSTKVSNQIEQAKLIANSFEEDKTIGWQTYTNSDSSFSLKYPKGWKVSSKFTSHTLALEGLQSSDTAAFAIDRYNSVGDLKYVDGTNDGKAVNSVSLKSYFSSQKLQYNAIKIGSIDGYEATNYPNIGGMKYYFAENNKNVYLISFDSNNQLEVAGILTTLQFTN